MVDWTQEYTVGDVAAIYAARLGEQPAEQYARRLRHILQQGVLAPRRRGEGRYARALFDREDVLFTRLILALADAGASNEHLAAATTLRDRIPEQPAGKVHKAGFALVVEGIQRGEDWFFNLHLSRSGHHGGSFALRPEAASELLNSFATITLPCASLLKPLLAELPVTKEEPETVADDQHEPISRTDEPQEMPPPPKVKGD